MTAVVGLGAGGHAKVVIEVLAAGGRYEVAGLVDPRPELRGSQVLGVEILGDDGELKAQRAAGVRHAFIGLAGDSESRRRLFELARQEGFEVVDAIHPSATISPSASIGEGVTVMASAVVNAGALLGENVIVNTGAIVEHDCVIGSHVHLAPGVRLAGGVQVGDLALVGLGASVIPGTRIGARAVVGAGAVVVRDVSEGDVVVGVPARVLRSS